MLSRAFGRLLCALGRHRWRPFGYCGGSIVYICQRWPCAAERRVLR